MRKLLGFPILAALILVAVFWFQHSSVKASSQNLIDDAVFDSNSMSATQIDSWLNTFPGSCISPNSGFKASDPVGYSPFYPYVDGKYSYGGPVTAGQVVYDAAIAHHINPEVLLTKLQNEEQLVDGSAGCDNWRYTSAVGYACTDGGTNTHNYTYTGADPYASGAASAYSLNDSTDLVTPLYYKNGAAVNSITGSCVNANVKAGFSEQVVHAAWLLSFSRHKSEGQTTWAAVGGNWNHCEDNSTCAASYNIPASWSCYSGFMTQGTYERCTTDTSGIYYDGYATIDGTSIHIDTGATAALYVYTPHFQSFDSIFTQYFGGIYAAPYNASYYSQSAYPALNPSQQASVYLEYQNLGSKTWYDDQSIGTAPSGTYPVHLATTNPLNRNSGFASNWPSSSRPAVTFSAVYYSDGTTLAPDQHVAQPGQVVKFSFNVTPASWVTAGTYNEYFQPVAEGSPGLFNDPGTYLGITVNKLTAVSWFSQSDYPTIAPSIKQTSSVSFKNTGTVPLYDDQSLSGAPGGTYPMHLAISCPMNTSSDFASGWSNPSRPAVTFSAVYQSDGTTLASNQHIAQPGQIVKFSFDLKTPNNYAAGTYKVCLQPVLEGTSDGYFPDMGVFLNVTVPSVAVLNYTNLPSSVPMVSGEQKTISFQLANVGNSPVASGSSIITSNGSSYQDTSWASSSTITSLGSPINPGASAGINMILLAPVTAANRNDTFGLEVHDTSNSTITSSSASMTINLSAPVFKAAFAGQSSYPSFSYGQVQNVYFMYKNTGNKPWYDDTSVGTTTATRNPLPMHLATASPLNRGSGFDYSWPSASRPAVNFSAVYEADGTTLAADQHVAQPGQIVKFGFNMAAQSWVNPGSYNEYFQPIIETTPDGAINPLGSYLSVKLNSPQYSSSFNSQSAYPTINAGQSAAVFMTFKNSGTAPWYDNTSFSSAPGNAKLYPVHLATSHPLNRTSSFSASWPSASRPAVNFSAVYEADGTTLAADQHVAQPGQIVKFGFDFAVPAGTASGTYKEYFQPVAEGSSTGLFNDQGTFLQINVP
jgi:hypothetical protein